MNKEVMENIKESAVLVGISTGVGFLAKKFFKENLIEDPSKSILNFVEWTVVMFGALYARDYLIKQKILPD